jgi:two-component system OmpR family response regulator
MEPCSVLLVDDDPRFLQIAAEYLRGYDEIGAVSTAEGGETAIAAARELRPQVILIDLIMPGLNGLGALPRLRALIPEAVIIALSVATAEAYRLAALAAGADEFVPKARLHNGLLPAIRRVLERQGEEGRKRQGDCDRHKPGDDRAGNKDSGGEETSGGRSIASDRTVG